MVCQIDDILIAAPHDETYFNTVKEAFHVLQKYNMTQRQTSISSWCIKSWRWDPWWTHTGYIPQPTDKEIVTIRDAPRPIDLKELKAYSGFLKYYGSFLQNLSTVLHPLHHLLE